MRRHRLFRPAAALSALVALAACAGTAPGPGAGSARWPFDDAPAGRAPVGWTFAYTGTGGDAAWAVAADASACSRPQVLRMTHARSPVPTFNVALLDEAAFGDVDVAVRVRADTGRQDQGGGIWRARDAQNYYICRLNPLELNFRVYKVQDGVRTELGSADVGCDAGTWYEVRATMVGDRIRCFVDGVQRLQVRDATFPGPGRVGLWTKADAASSFDDFRAGPAR
jgi:hypothetical protein